MTHGPHPACRGAGRAAIALLLAAPGLAACAGATPVLELTPWSPPSGQSCDATGMPSEGVTVADSVAVAEAVQRLRPADGALLLSVGRRPTGETRTPRAFRIQATLPEADAGALEEALEALYRDEEGRARLLLEVEDGRVSRLAQSPSRACRPVVTNRWELTRLLTGVAHRFRKEATLNVWLFADTTGAVTKGRINTGSGDPTLDGAVLAAMKQARFLPALLDERPVGVWAALDATVRVACPPTPPGQQWTLPLDDPCRPSHPPRPAARRRPPPDDAR